jgi:hypothetical protein
MRSGRWSDLQLHAGQPVNADGSTSGVAPELNELFYGDPSDVGDADHIAVEVGFQDARATWHGQIFFIFFIFYILSLLNQDS